MNKPQNFGNRGKPSNTNKQKANDRSNDGEEPAPWRTTKQSVCNPKSCGWGPIITNLQSFTESLKVSVSGFVPHVPFTTAA